MKYFKYILGMLAILVIGYFILGLIKPELTYECKIMLEKPLEESWAVSQDQDKMQDWLDGFQKIEEISAIPGTVGAISDVYFITDGQEMTIRETITDIVPDEFVSMFIESDFMDMNYTLAMTSKNGKTRINTKTVVVGNGMVSKSIIALMGNSFKTLEETNLNNLKNTIENNTKKYDLS